jgi:uncharacterized membrane protein
MSTRVEPELSTRAEPAPPASRMAIAVLALIGIFVAGYLSLYKFGYLGFIQCATGGCETVQASAWAYFPPRTVVLWGPPVALWGVGAYLALLGLALMGLQPRWVGERWVALAISGISAVGVAFSGWLTYLEAVVIHAWCQWCVISAVLITLIFLLSLPGLRPRSA